MIYNSIVPSRMTQDELINLSSKLSSANRWGATCVTVKLKNGSSLLFGVVYDRLQTKLFEQQEDEVSFSAYTLKLGINVKYSDKWSATYLLLPKIASNFEESLTKNDYQIGGIILAKLKKSEHFNYKFGAYINGDRFGSFLVPFFGGYYQKKKLCNLNIN